MFKPVRVIATIVFLAMIGLIFVGAFVIKIGVSPLLRFSQILGAYLAPRLFYLVPVHP